MLISDDIWAYGRFIPPVEQLQPIMDAIPLEMRKDLKKRSTQLYGIVQQANRELQRQVKLGYKVFAPTPESIDADNCFYLFCGDGSILQTATWRVYMRALMGHDAAEVIEGMVRAGKIHLPCQQPNISEFAGVFSVGHEPIDGRVVINFRANMAGKMMPRYGRPLPETEGELNLHHWRAYLMQFYAGYDVLQLLMRENNI